MDLHKAARDPWVWGQLVLFLLVLVGVPVMTRWVSLGDLDYALNRVGPLWIRVVGGLIAVAGLALARSAARALGPSLTPGTEPLPGAPLVVTGPYGYVRHPIYAGIVLFLAGYAMAWSNWTLGLLVGFVALQYFEGKARAEERWLTARDAEYARYTVRVRRRVL